MILLVLGVSGTSMEMKELSVVMVMIVGGAQKSEGHLEDMKTKSCVITKHIT